MTPYPVCYLFSSSLQHTELSPCAPAQCKVTKASPEPDGGCKLDWSLAHSKEFQPLSRIKIWAIFDMGEEKKILV